MTDAHGKWGVCEWTSTWRGKTSMAVFCDHGYLQKPLVQHRGQQTLFKRQYKTISTGDSDPKWHSKGVNFPVCSGGAKKFLRLSQEKVGGGLLPAKHMGGGGILHASCPFILTASPPFDRWGKWGLPVGRQLSGVVPRFEPTFHVCLSPNSSSSAMLSQIGTEGMFSRERQGC